MLVVTGMPSLPSHSLLMASPTPLILLVGVQLPKSLLTRLQTVLRLPPWKLFDGDDLVADMNDMGGWDQCLPPLVMASI